ncbi:MAG: TPM domain-containing protein, partial [Leptospiraceae bacterium]|nr:TPM domain-containing protein [Leptospiraceae bacterium]
MIHMLLSGCFLRNRAPGLFMGAGLFLAIILTPGYLYAQVESNEPREIPPAQQYVLDKTDLLTPAQIRSLNENLAAFEDETGSQVVVVVVASTRPESIEEYTLRLAEAWAVGRSEFDDGVILLIARDDRKLRIEVGYGLEGALPDARCKRIIDGTIVPRFRDQDFYGGIQAGIKAIQESIRAEQLPAPESEESEPGFFDFVGEAVLRIIALLALPIRALALIIGIVYASRENHHRGLGWPLAILWIYTLLEMFAYFLMFSNFFPMQFVRAFVESVIYLVIYNIFTGRFQWTSAGGGSA